MPRDKHQDEYDELFDPDYEGVPITSEVPPATADRPAGTYPMVPPSGRGVPWWLILLLGYIAGRKLLR